MMQGFEFPVVYRVNSKQNMWNYKIINNMKKLKTMMLLMAVALTTVSLQSCDTDDDDYVDFNLATVTLKAPQAEGGKWFMQLDDDNIIYANNIASHPYENKELRAYIRYNDMEKIGESSKVPGEYTADILTIDTILTKKMSPLVEVLPTASETDDANAETYGDDPVEIVNSWETVAEDGYMNIRFRTRFGYNGKHRVSLVHRTDVNEPYLVEFYHDANGDTNGQVNDGIVAFKLDDVFNEGDEPIEITLRWKSYSGVKTAKFKYRPRKD